jgi:hypothetical protein
VVNGHIENHKHVQKLYEELLANVSGVTVHALPTHVARIIDCIILKVFVRNERIFDENRKYRNIFVKEIVAFHLSLY